MASAQDAFLDNRGDIKVKYRSTGKEKEQNAAVLQPGLLLGEWITLMDESEESLRLQVISNEMLARSFSKKMPCSRIQGLYLQKSH